MSTPIGPDPRAGLLTGPAATTLPAALHDPAVAALDGGAPAATVAAGTPAASLPWAVLAEAALARAEQARTDGDDPRRLGEAVAAYAYARTGYHRGLDALRRAGWKGHGPVPWSHEPNRGFLRSVQALAAAADHVGERDEVDRLAALLQDSDPTLST